VVAQFAGAFVGMLAAHAMFDLALLQSPEIARTGAGQWWSEIVATFGLVLVVLSCDGERPWSAPVAVGAYIAAASPKAPARWYSSPARPQQPAAANAAAAARP